MNVGTQSPNMDSSSTVKSAVCRGFTGLDIPIRRTGTQWLTSRVLGQFVPIAKATWRSVDSLDGPLWIDSLYDPTFVQEMMDLLGKVDENPGNHNLKITTGKKIRGYLGAIIQESPLAEHTVSYNLERIYCRKGKLIPSKLTVLLANQFCFGKRWV